MKGYKLTNADAFTLRGKDGETAWSVGATVAPTGKGSEPCGPGVLHFYGSPEEAMLYDPIHGDYTPNARLLEIEVGVAETDGLKWWTAAPVKVLDEVKLPNITTEKRVAWAICLAPHPSTRDWAIGWLSGRDRSADAAWAAARAAEAAREAAARAAAVDKNAFPRRSLAALTRARAILSGKFPAERYDEPLIKAEDETRTV